MRPMSDAERAADERDAALIEAALRKVRITAAQRREMDKAHADGKPYKVGVLTICPPKAYSPGAWDITPLRQQIKEEHAARNRKRPAHLRAEARRGYVKKFLDGNWTGPEIIEKVKVYHEINMDILHRDIKTLRAEGFDAKLSKRRGQKPIDPVMAKRNAALRRLCDGTRSYDEIAAMLKLSDAVVRSAVKRLRVRDRRPYKVLGSPDV
jgi:biotin operon repressor